MDDKRLERIETKIDDVSDHLGTIDVILSRQHESLKYHIKRSDMLEEKLIPIEKHVNLINSVSKIITFLATLGSVIGVALKLMKVF